ncbi:inovirus Gp2 family protein [Desulfomarina profundi]|uniref:inovirus Gp2 family protein n=1 Tax=Desulfomarina profundi TaxID=2772557 RepID=UPI001E41AF4B|nr:inovirus Gp2 family protein [Desulfomarina profundi]
MGFKRGFLVSEHHHHHIMFFLDGSAYIDDLITDCLGNNDDKIKFALLAGGECLFS